MAPPAAAAERCFASLSGCGTRERAEQRCLAPDVLHLTPVRSQGTNRKRTNQSGRNLNDRFCARGAFDVSDKESEHRDRCNTNSATAMSDAPELEPIAMPGQAKPSGADGFAAPSALNARRYQRRLSFAFRVFLLSFT